MKNAQPKTKDVEVIAKKGGALANINIEQFADSGFDNVDAKSVALPFLKVLGQLSPQVTQGDSQFIEAARAGMIFNTVTNQLFNGSRYVFKLHNRL